MSQVPLNQYSVPCDAFIPFNTKYNALSADRDLYTGFKLPLVFNDFLLKVCMKLSGDSDILCFAGGSQAGNGIRAFLGLKYQSGHLELSLFDTVFTIPVTSLEYRFSTVSIAIRYKKNCATSGF